MEAAAAAAAAIFAPANYAVHFERIYRGGEGGGGMAAPWAGRTKWNGPFNNLGGMGIVMKTNVGESAVTQCGLDGLYIRAYVQCTCVQWEGGVMGGEGTRLGMRWFEIDGDV